jgi:hypothetical protein
MAPSKSEVQSLSDLARYQAGNALVGIAGADGVW